MPSSFFFLLFWCWLWPSEFCLCYLEGRCFLSCCIAFFLLIKSFTFIKQKRKTNKQTECALYKSLFYFLLNKKTLSLITTCNILHLSLVRRGREESVLQKVKTCDRETNLANAWAAKFASLLTHIKSTLENLYKRSLTSWLSADKVHGQSSNFPIQASIFYKSLCIPLQWCNTWKWWQVVTTNY